MDNYHNFTIGEKIKVNSMDYVPPLKESILEVTSLLNYFVYAKDSNGVEYIVNTAKAEHIKTD